MTRAGGSPGIGRYVTGGHSPWALGALWEIQPRAGGREEARKHGGWGESTRVPASKEAPGWGPAVTAQCRSWTGGQWGQEQDGAVSPPTLGTASPTGALGEVPASCVRRVLLGSPCRSPAHSPRDSTVLDSCFVLGLWGCRAFAPLPGALPTAQWSDSRGPRGCRPRWPPCHGHTSTDTAPSTQGFPGLDPGKGGSSPHPLAILMGTETRRLRKAAGNSKRAPVSRPRRKAEDAGGLKGVLFA